MCLLPLFIRSAKLSFLLWVDFDLVLVPFLPFLIFRVLYVLFAVSSAGWSSTSAAGKS